MRLYLFSVDICTRVCMHSSFVSLFFFQLYEIDDNPKRKEFLDELFSFMQKRGEFV